MRKILWAVLILAVFYSLGRAWDRFHLERANRSVEIALDYDGFLDLCQKEGLPLAATLERFHALGVTAVAPSESTLEKLHQDGKLVWIPGADLAFFKTKALYNRIPKHGFPFFVVLTRDEKLHDWLLHAFTALLGRSRFQVFRGGFTVSGEWDDLSQVGLGLDPEQLKPLLSSGFRIDPRTANRDEIDQGRTNYLLDNLASLPEVSTVIFSGLRNEVLGYDSEIPRVAQFLREHHIAFGYVEAYDPGRVLKGSLILARRIPDLVVKVQSLNFPPLARIDVGRAVDIFLLGVRERNVRIIYFRPFLTNTGGESLLKVNLDFLERLRNNLRKGGFVLGPARPYPASAPGLTGVLIVALGFLAATFLLVLLYLDVSPSWIAGTAVGLILILVLSNHFGEFGLLRSMLAFWGANLFPILGFVWFSPARPMNFVRSVLALGKITLVTVLGGFMVSAILADDLTLLGVEGFRGVKALFVIPVLLSPWLSWLYLTHKGRFAGWREWFRKFGAPLGQPVRVLHLSVILLLLIGGLFMIIRSGNVVPEGAVPEWERTAREFLESSLGARPRFKECLLGHPFFMVAAALGLDQGWALFFLLLAALGQADIMDSFAHLHTPLQMTLLRTFNGLWIGVLIGALFRFVLEKVRPVLS